MILFNAKLYRSSRDVSLSEKSQVSSRPEILTKRLSAAIYQSSLTAFGNYHQRHAEGESGVKALLKLNLWRWLASKVPSPGHDVVEADCDDDDEGRMKPHGLG